MLLLQEFEGHKEFAKAYDDYTAMMEKVRAWQPPSESHQNLKELMIEDLEESIAEDVTDYSYSNDEREDHLTDEEYIARHYAEPGTEYVEHFKETRLEAQRHRVEVLKWHVARLQSQENNPGAWIRELIKSIEE